MMVGDAEFRKIWLWGKVVSSSAAGRFGRSLAGLDVGFVDEAVVEEEAVEACGLGVQGRVGVHGTGVVATSQILSIGGKSSKDSFLGAFSEFCAWYFLVKKETCFVQKHKNEERINSARGMFQLRRFRGRRRLCA